MSIIISILIAFLIVQFILVIMVIKAYLSKDDIKDKWEPRLIKVGDKWRWGPYNKNKTEWYKADSNIPTWDSADGCSIYCSMLNG